MTPDRAEVDTEPFFLGSGADRRFCLFHRPAGTCRGAVLYVPPFAEELNRTRRMAALGARRLAALGYGVLQIDLYGTGDSAGDFGDARWDAWQQDLDTGAAWLRARADVPLTLWGLRLGALLALDCAAGAREVPHRLLLWQPMTSGAAVMNQFLRLRIAADMVQEGAANGGTKALRAALEQGRSVEIAGYELAPQLAAAIDPLDASVLAPRGCRIDWFEVTPAAGRPLPPASSRVTAIWQAQRIDFGVHLVHGEQFWTTPEIAECPALLDATSRLYPEAAHAG